MVGKKRVKVKSFGEFVAESSDGKRKYYSPSQVFNGRQLRALMKHPHYQNYVSHPYTKVYVRRDDDPTFDNTYHIANEHQKHVMSVDISRHGKIFGSTVRRRERNERGETVHTIVARSGET